MNSFFNFSGLTDKLKCKNNSFACSKTLFLSPQFLKQYHCSEFFWQRVKKFLQLHGEFKFSRRSNKRFILKTFGTYQKAFDKESLMTQLLLNVSAPWSFLFVLQVSKHLSLVIDPFLLAIFREIFISRKIYCVHFGAQFTKNIVVTPYCIPHFLPHFSCPRALCREKFHFQIAYFSKF